MMARSRQAPWLLLSVLVALAALTCQAGKKTFIRVQEESGVQGNAKDVLQFFIDEFNRQNEDKYKFRILRVLNVKRQVTDHMEYHICVHMQRTTCLKSETTLCGPQEGALHKQIECCFSMFTIPWFEKYRILKQNCSSS
ncbi:cystatin-11 [Carlito syrichta]|uniref:Cystatin-11 n=1 Tax=Carlito syrichta TaxID=1868482 RepID=A0A1U7TPA7_CARSF|nr:cystatin-11 [Carlito syrichta]